jgi:hypothetical protein
MGFPDVPGWLGKPIMRFAVSVERQNRKDAAGIGSRRPDLIVRIGRGPQMPRSLRRPVHQVIARG